MANRPVYIPAFHGKIGVKECGVDFIWSPGMAVVQKQKSIRSLHESANDLGMTTLLEISSKSESELGVKLSAFNLNIVTKKLKSFSVETAFQSSKNFEDGGPFIDLLSGTSIEAKKDIRLKESGNLINFKFLGLEFPLNPRTYFYDWLYINAVYQNEEVRDEISNYNGFTDIEFNPKKSINCQAYSAALYVSIMRAGELNDSLKDPRYFLALMDYEYNKAEKKTSVQGILI